MGIGLASAAAVPASAGAAGSSGWGSGGVSGSSSRRSSDGLRMAAAAAEGLRGSISSCSSSGSSSRGALSRVESMPSLLPGLSGGLGGCVSGSHSLPGLSGCVSGSLSLPSLPVVAECAGDTFDAAAGGGAVAAFTAVAGGGIAGAAVMGVGDAFVAAAAQGTPNTTQARQSGQSSAPSSAIHSPAPSMSSRRASIEAFGRSVQGRQREAGPSPMTVFRSPPLGSRPSFLLTNASRRVFLELPMSDQQLLQVGVDAEGGGALDRPLRLPKREAEEGTNLSHAEVMAALQELPRRRRHSRERRSSWEFSEDLDEHVVHSPTRRGRRISTTDKVFGQRELTAHHEEKYRVHNSPARDGSRSRRASIPNSPDRARSRRSGVLRGHRLVNALVERARNISVEGSGFGGGSVEVGGEGGERLFQRRESGGRRLSLQIVIGGVRDPEAASYNYPPSSPERRSRRPSITVPLQSAMFINALKSKVRSNSASPNVSPRGERRVPDPPQQSTWRQATSEDLAYPHTEETDAQLVALAGGTIDQESDRSNLLLSDEVPEAIAAALARELGGSAPGPARTQALPSPLQGRRPGVRVDLLPLLISSAQEVPAIIVPDEVMRAAGNGGGELEHALLVHERASSSLNPFNRGTLPEATSPSHAFRATNGPSPLPDQRPMAGAETGGIARRGSHLSHAAHSLSVAHPLSAANPLSARIPFPTSATDGGGGGGGGTAEEMALAFALQVHPGLSAEPRGQKDAIPLADEPRRGDEPRGRGGGAGRHSLVGASWGGGRYPLAEGSPLAKSPWRSLGGFGGEEGLGNDGGSGRRNSTEVLHTGEGPEESEALDPIVEGCVHVCMEAGLFGAVCSREQALQIVPHLAVRSLERYSRLYREGSAGDHMYLVLRGSLVLKSFDAGADVVITVGGCVGEEAMWLPSLCGPKLCPNPDPGDKGGDKVDKFEPLPRLCTATAGELGATLLAISAQSVPTPLRLGVHRRVAARLLAEHSGMLFSSIVKLSLAGRSGGGGGVTLLEEAAEMFRFINVNTDSVICKQGAAADAFFVMLRGSARALVWLPTKPREAIHVGNIRAVEGGKEISRYFGEAGLIASSRAKSDKLPVRTASIVADEPCLLLVLPRENYDKFTRLLPGIADHFGEAKAIQEEANLKIRATKKTVANIFAHGQPGDSAGTEAHGFGAHKKYDVLQKQRKKFLERKKSIKGLNGANNML
ncbi:hypothetical protein T492DRAFT_363480 [Pavlovales sp. CCMP2436]|nr:hypothetical protein T492DRAFT_363480 [Pavlovales sp. CCMP2436]